MVGDVAPCLVADIKGRRSELLGHVIEMEQWQKNSFLILSQKVDEKMGNKMQRTIYEN